MLNARRNRRCTSLSPKCCLIVTLLVLPMFACTPLQTVRPLPDFVALAIDLGDRVELITVSGDRFAFKVTQIDDRSIGSQNDLILFKEIDELYVRSRKRPVTPCGGIYAPGCSVPGKVKFFERAVSVTTDSADVFGRTLGAVAASWHSEFGETFFDACLQHDFCYRHGNKTYGRDKEGCDTEFYENMLALCENKTCEVAAKEFHWAVKEHAEDGAFQTTTSTYCEYDGPP